MSDAASAAVHTPVMTAAEAALGWREREGAPEMRCIPAWIEACRAWWTAPGDARLCRRVCEVLLVSEAELAAWQHLVPDEATLIRAHRHVVSMRAAFERGAVRRTLVTGALRTGPVVSYLRTGRRVEFPDARVVPAHVAELARSFETLPRHVLHRAAWLAEVIGAIHPFVDSNGGTLRFLASVELSRACLPPLALTWAQRSGAYVAAVAQHDLGALEQVTHGIVQQELARLLLRGGAGTPAWDAVAAARAGRWTAITDSVVREHVGGALEVDAPGAAGLARLARRGYHLRAVAPPRATRWRLAVPFPIQVELAIAPAAGGPTPWSVAVVGGSVGDDGALAPLLGREEVSHVFVAPASEEDALVDERFARWVRVRVSQCVRGLASWM